MNRPLITEIQKYSIHDGEGIRTTVFFKGCPLSCTWCHNPETQGYKQQLLFQAERCTGCGECINVCPFGAVSIKEGIAVTEKSRCKQCGDCSDNCLQNIRNISGKYYSVNELIHEIEKDRAFYDQSGGGVTFSGGEVLAQNMIYLEELLVKLHRKGYRINMDTCGYVPFDHMKTILPYVDTFLYDIKMMDANLHKMYTGVDNILILENLKKLNQEDVSLWIRIPVIGGVNNTVSNMEQTAEFMKREAISVKQICLLPYHNTGIGKYMRLHQEYKGVTFYTPSKEELDSFITIFKSCGFSRIKIGG